MMEWILSACVLTAAVIGLRYALGGGCCGTSTPTGCWASTPLYC